MTDEEIEANIEAIIAALCKHRSPALGPFINRATMAILPHKTYFSLNVDKYVPVATVDEVEKVCIFCFKWFIYEQTLLWRCLSV